MQIGEKIKNLRIKNSLTQEELANRSELTKGFISQLERDLTSPSIATLVKENEEYRNTISWIIPNAQKNAMEPILVEIEAGGKTKDIDPHEGEEFGYVLSGSIMLHIGMENYRVKKGESFYYKPGKKHHLSNYGKVKATIIWVSTPPIF